MAVVDRMGPSLYASASPAGQALAPFRIPENAASSLPGRRAPVWTFLHGLKSGLSSTALRALRTAPKPAAAPQPATETAGTAAPAGHSSNGSAGKRSTSNNAKAKAPKTIKMTKKPPSSKRTSAAVVKEIASKVAPRKAGHKSAK